jgi:predicted Holliday junction resolvase-like endonuclease
MYTDASELIRYLQTSKLYADCPHCNEEFPLAGTILFDGSGIFPDEAEKRRLELEEELKQKQDMLLKRQVSADTGAEKKAIEVGIGKIIEKILPSYKNFSIIATDCRFLAEPIDMVIFDGLSENNINNITFLDVKTGNAPLNKHQRLIRDAINDQKVKFKVI